jgi:hypothetical protein
LQTALFPTQAVSILQPICRDTTKPRKLYKILTQNMHISVTAAATLRPEVRHPHCEFKLQYQVYNAVKTKLVFISLANVGE